MHKCIAILVISGPFCKAGIPDGMLTLALEPEAASLYSKHVIGQAAMYVGCRYMVLDIGGKQYTLDLSNTDP